MKSMCLFLGAGLVSVLVGCTSITPVAVAQVGPNPFGIRSKSSKGELQVFSCLTAQSDDQNQGSTDPIWSQHTDYYIYDLRHKLIKHVDNTIGHYEEAPRVVALPAGTYLVKAHANDYFWVDVPVTIEPGRTTRVHLDDHWGMTGDAAKLVSLPNGKPIGWRSEDWKPSGMN
jgi:hypothetical protein